MKTDSPITLPFGLHHIVDASIKILIAVLLCTICIIPFLRYSNLKIESDKTRIQQQIKLQYLAQALEGNVLKPILDNGYPLVVVDIGYLTVHTSETELVYYNIIKSDESYQFQLQGSSNNGVQPDGSGQSH